MFARSNTNTNEKRDEQSKIQFNRIFRIYSGGTILNIVHCITSFSFPLSFGFKPNTWIHMKKPKVHHVINTFIFSIYFFIKKNASPKQKSRRKNSKQIEKYSIRLTNAWCMITKGKTMNEYYFSCERRIFGAKEDVYHFYGQNKLKTFEINIA